MGTVITAEQAERVWVILEEYAGASRSTRDEFMYAATVAGITEFRFGGLLGFGGKFWINCGRWYVNCYREDELPSRLMLIAAINEKLEELCSAAA